VLQTANQIRLLRGGRRVDDDDSLEPLDFVAQLVHERRLLRQFALQRVNRLGELVPLRHAGVDEGAVNGDTRGVVDIVAVASSLVEHRVDNGGAVAELTAQRAQFEAQRVHKQLVLRHALAQPHVARRVHDKRHNETNNQRQLHRIRFGPHCGEQVWQCIHSSTAN
jgi:hypothetical protein